MLVCVTQLVSVALVDNFVFRLLYDSEHAVQSATQMR
jgi:hypothetical protein